MNLPAGDAQLEAACVELGTTLAVSKMESNDLVAHNVVAVLEALGEVNGVLGSELH